MSLIPALTKRQIHQFVFQLASLLKGHLSLIEALELIASTGRDKALKHFLNQLMEQIRQGKPLHKVLAQYPKYFNRVFLQLVEIGENTGCLIMIMHQLAVYQNQQQLLQKKLIKALSYPLFVLSIALVISIVLLVKVIPQFAELFVQFKQDLPLLTRQVITTSSWLQQNGFYLLLFSLGCLLVLWVVKRISFLHSLASGLLIRLPFFGKVIMYGDIIKYSQTLKIMLTAKVSLNKAMKIAANLDVNMALQRQFARLALAVEHGEGIQQGSRQHKPYYKQHKQRYQKQYKRYAILPEYLIQVLSAGEKSGQLDQLLDILIDDYQQSFNHLVQVSMSLIEPLLMVFLGLFVGLLLLAVYLPLFDLGSLF